MKFIRVEGTQETMPSTFDTESSTTVVYLRRNIERVSKEGQDGEVIEVWQYDEAEVPKRDFDKAVEYIYNLLDESDKSQSEDIENLGDAIIEMSEIIYS